MKMKHTKYVRVFHDWSSQLLQTVDKLKIELEKNNIDIIAVEGFEMRGDLSFQMDKLKVKC